MAKPTHGMTGTSLYNRYKAMFYRCENPNNKRYKDYGARGINVCGEWRDFDTFRAWAEATGYNPELQLDRIDNDGPYSPENCRWVTPAQNGRNRRDSRLLEIGGVTMVLQDAAAKFGVAPSTISTRLARGMSAEDAVQDILYKLGPQGTTGRFYSYFGETLSFIEAERKFGIKWQTIRYRIEAGMTPEEAVTKPLRKAA